MAPGTPRDSPCQPAPRVLRFAAAVPVTRRIPRRGGRRRPEAYFRSSPTGCTTSTAQASTLTANAVPGTVPASTHDPRVAPARFENRPRSGSSPHWNGLAAPGARILARGRARAPVCVRSGRPSYTTRRSSALAPVPPARGPVRLPRCRTRTRRQATAGCRRLSHRRRSRTTKTAGFTVHGLAGVRGRRSSRECCRIPFG